MMLLFCLVLLVSSISAAPSTYDKLEAAKRELTDTSDVDFSNKIPVVTANVTTKDPDGVVREHKFRAPYYRADERPLPQELQTYSSKSVDRLVRPIEDIIDSAMIKNQFFIKVMGLIASSGLKYLFTIRELHQKSNSLRRKYNYPIDEGFTVETLLILPKAIHRAQAELSVASKESKKKYESVENRARVAKRILLILEGSRALVKNSPVGAHLKFNEMTVDGELMVNELVENLKFMLQGGLGYLLENMSSLCRKAADNNKNTVAN